MARLLKRLFLVATIVVATIVLPGAPPAHADFTPDGGIFRDPDVSTSRIVFVYGDDLWTVPRTGGTATPLASPEGLETTPRFSPDGKTIAFGAAYDGPEELYTLPVDGGIPHRVTYHPSPEHLCDWTADGDLLFSMRGLAGLGRMTQLFRVPASGGLPVRLPVPYGGLGSIDPTGRRLAYVPEGGDNPSWKRYCGGMASDVWLFDLVDHTSKRLTDWKGTDTWPMWHGDAVYYLSDEGPAHHWNLWRVDVVTGKRRQVTTYAEQDVRWPAMGPGPAGQGEIVFQLGEGLHLLDLATEKVRDVPIRIPGARPTIRPQRVDVSRRIANWNVGPTGERAVVEARGDVWTLPAQHGSPRNLTRTCGEAERDPAWSPDGRHIAYFCDSSGTYELTVRPADGSGEPRALTKDSDTFYFRPTWSPDSKKIAYTDKAAVLYVTDVESGTTKRVDQDPIVEDEGIESFSWSSDSRWLAYARGKERVRNRSVYLYDSRTGESTQVTSDLFDDGVPTFDRKGDFLYLRSSRHFSPRYADLQPTWIYDDTQVLLMVPLRRDVASPFLPKSDEEKAAAAASRKKDAHPESGAKGVEPASGEDDGISGTWEGQATGDPLPPGGLSFTLTLHLEAGGGISGSLSLAVGAATVVDGSFDRASGRVELSLEDDDGNTWKIHATVSGESVSGRATLAAAGLAVRFEGKRTSKAKPAQPEAEGGNAPGKTRGPTGEKAKDVEIDLDGFEGRAILLPIKPGEFGALAVTDRGRLLYGRRGERGGDQEPVIQVFDPSAEKPREQDVAKGTDDFRLSGDGKHLLIVRGRTATLGKPAPGDAGKPVVTRGMDVLLDPRAEWHELVSDAWRIMDEYFYDPDMHGVDWKAVKARYLALVDDCLTHEDVDYVIHEMIGELNVGHAYYFARGRHDRDESEPMGFLGVDWSLENGAYRIQRILHGAPWDVDARGPLDQPGLDVHEGDYVLAVDGVSVDTTRAPWAAFQGTAGRTITLTVSKKPVRDADAREVVVQPVGDEGGLRYRAWVEANREHVDEASGGRVGYVHVPNTGRQGQNELVRQIQGQLTKDALIIDERWNSGGQLPDRFVELLDRPIRNYWARRDGVDWPTPDFAHQGPMCMLINGSAGSGGDAFPYYFRQSKLGPLIGTRTWGGLVGISGNPGLIDGTYMTVPTFAFYETNGTWGIEGHGVDPDIEVIDDPALMLDGKDPQLDKAISVMLEALKHHAYVPPKRPAYPNRSGMGILPADR